MPTTGSGQAYSIVFLSTAVEHFQEVYDQRLDQLIGSARADGAQSEKFMALGRYDHMMITVSSKTDSLSTIDHQLQSDPLIADHWALYGRILDEAPIDPEKLTAQYPIVGICLLKLGDDGVEMNFHRHFDRLQALKRSIEADSDDQLRISIGSSTGWEDAVVLIFANSFTPIATTVGKIRDIQTDSGTLAYVTTCTIPAIQLRWTKAFAENVEPRKSELDRLQAIVKFDEKMDWAVRFEVLPGGLARLQSGVQEKMQLTGVPFETVQTFGQIDIGYVSVRDSVGATTGSLLRFLLNIGFPTAAQSDSPVRSMQTALMLPHPIDFNVSSSLPALIQSPLGAPSIKNLLWETAHARLESNGVPPLSLRLIEATLIRIQSLQADELLRTEFISIGELYQAFLKATAILPPDVSLDQREFRENLSYWQTYVDRSISDRYRGRYPAGENMRIRLGSYHGSHQKFLAVIDQLAQQAYALTCREYGRHGGTVPESMSGVRLVAHIGNSPSPQVIVESIKYLRGAFIDIPSDLFLKIHHASYLIHEVGHVVLESFMQNGAALHGSKLRDSEGGNLLWGKKTLRYSFKEMLAEFLPFCLLAKGDTDLSMKRTIDILDSFFSIDPNLSPGAKDECRKKSKTFQSLFIEKQYQVLALSALYKRCSADPDSTSLVGLGQAFREDPAYNGVEIAIKDLLKDEPEREREVMLANGRDVRQGYASALICLEKGCQQDPSYGRFCRAIASLVLMDSADYRDEFRVLALFQEYLVAEADGDPGVNSLQFLDTCWATACCRV
jgi:hypothetical protein